jgi:hypothetical protein
MLRLKLVKGADLVREEQDENQGNQEVGLLHGTQVLKHVTPTSLRSAQRRSFIETDFDSLASSRRPRTDFQNPISRTLNSMNAATSMP